MQGRPEVAELCGCSAVSDSAGRAIRKTVYGLFFLLLISSFPLSLFWFSFTLSARLELICFPFYLLPVTFHLPEFILSCLSFPLFSFLSLPPSHPLPLSLFPPHPFRPLIPCHLGLKTLMQAVFCQKAVGMLLQSIQA